MLLQACSSDDDNASTPSVVDAGSHVDAAPTGNPVGSGVTSTSAIGNAGGIVTAGKGTIDIGAGALPATTSITVTESTTPVPSQYTALSPLYTFTPEGLLFSAPVAVHIAYTGPTSGVSIFWSRLDDPTKYDAIQTTFGNGEATAEVTHFSTAFIAYLPGGADAAACNPTACPAAGQSPQGLACTPCSSACATDTQLCMCANNVFSCFQTPTAPDAGTPDAGDEAGTKASTDTPTATPPQGNYTSVQDVTLADTTSGATIYYTLDGSDPTTASAVYANVPIHLVATTTLKFLAAKDGFDPSPIVTASYNITLSASAPTFTPNPGQYTGSVTVTIADATDGATVYYTTDGTNPTAASPIYQGPFQVTKTTTVKALAVKSGINNSVFGAITYQIIQTPTVATPTFSPNGGSFATAQTVSITSTTPNATIYYTLDGTTPTTASAVYTAAITVAASETVKAYATAASFVDSAVASATFSLATTVDPPAFSPAGGTFGTAQTVTLTSTTAGATIYYTTDGTTPTTASPLYNGTITVSSTQTLKAIAVKAGLTTSIVSTASFTLAATAPIFTPAPGSFQAPTQVTLTTTTPSGTIYYTSDGSTPTTSSNPYGGAITVSTTTTIKAIAVGPGLSASAVVSGTYTIDTSTVAAPSFSPAAGTYTTSVTVSATSPGANVYCTIDGTTPTAASPSCGSLAVTSATTIKAIAINGTKSSVVNTASYAIQAATPTFSPTPGVVNGTSQQVTISDPTPGVTIFYTVNPNTTTCTTQNSPTTASSIYSTPITVSGATQTTICALAAKSNLVNSALGSATYTIGGLVVGAPSYNPFPGSYATAQIVYLSSSTPGATIYYTTDGAVPDDTANSLTYSDAGIPLAANSGDTDIRAIAKAADDAGATYFSEEVDGEYSISTASTNPPTLSPNPPNNPDFQNSGVVTITTTPANLAVYYTTDGTNPGTTVSGTTKLYSSPITITTTTTFKALALNGTTPSSIVSVTYNVDVPSASAPAFNPSQGTYTSTVSVTASSSTPGAKIYYTTDGSTPTTGSSLFPSAGITLTATTTAVTANYKAITVADGYAASIVSSANYVVQPQTAPPTFNVIPKSYSQTQNVTLTLSSTSGSTTFYSLNGAAPIQYTAGTQIPVTVNGTTIEAYATAPGYADSADVGGAYTLLVNNPTISPASSTATTGPGTVTITAGADSGGSTLRYTTAALGTTCDPTVGGAMTSTTGSATVPVAGPGAIVCAIGVRTDFQSSSVIMNTYDIIAPTPTINITSNGGSTMQQGFVTFSFTQCTSTNGQVHYTYMAGSAPADPTPADTAVANGGTLQLSTTGQGAVSPGSYIVKAICTGDNVDESNVAQTAFTLSQ